jgi:hypothetical protein
MPTMDGWCHGLFSSMEKMVSNVFEIWLQHPPKSSSIVQAAQAIDYNLRRICCSSPLFTRAEEGKRNAKSVQCCDPGRMLDKFLVGYRLNPFSPSR